MKQIEKIKKFICGAGNENIDEIEKLSFIFACAGFNMIDIPANINAFNAAHSGIKKAEKSEQVSVCISIGLNDDIHFSKASVIHQNCNMCKSCILSCIRNAICIKNGTIFIDKKKCIGCSKCIKTCSKNAIIIEYKNSSPIKMLLPFKGKSVDCIEFHCSSNDEAQILNYWNKIKSIQKSQLSICISRSKLCDEKIISILKTMVKNTDDVIIQADGRPMSGNKNDYKSNLQTVSFADLIRSNGINSLLILSGGTNAKTSEFAKLCEVDINGVAIGSFARELVNEYVICNDFWSNKEIQKKAILLAQKLADSI